MGLVTAISAGSRILGETLAEWRTQINSLTAPGWTDWSATFAIQAPTTNPTKGNSTYLARYRRPDGSDVVDFEFRVLIGSTFAVGSGVYRFTVPFNASANAILAANGCGYILDAGTANRQIAIRFETAGVLSAYLNGSSSAINNTGSGTAWATGDIISGSIRYEPA